MAHYVQLSEMCRNLKTIVILTLLLATNTDAFAEYQIVARSVRKYGKELYPLGAPGVSSSGLAAYSSQSGIDWLDPGHSVLGIVGCRCIGHDTIGSVGSLMRSYDRGRTWSTIQNEQIIFNPNPAFRVQTESVRLLHSGRIVSFAQIDHQDGNVEPWLVFSDDQSATWSSVALPWLGDGPTKFTRYMPPFQSSNSNRVWISGYYFDTAAARKTPIIYYSDDPTLSTWSQKGGIIDNCGTGCERKEPNCKFFDDGSHDPNQTMMCLIRTEDNTGNIVIIFSYDGGLTFTPERIAFTGANDPRWIQPFANPNDVLCQTRAYTPGNPNLNSGSTSIVQVSHDRGITWPTTINLCDPLIDSGQCANVAGDLIELENGRIGITVANAKASAPTNQARAEFIMIDPNPASAGTYAPYSIDSVFSKKHPSKYVSNVFAWFNIESARTDYIVGSNVTRWHNSMGIPSRDLVWGGQESPPVFQDGADITSGIIGGKGVLQNHGQGGGNLQFATVTSISQPVSVTIVMDAAQIVGAMWLIDDGSGTTLRYDGAKFFSQMTGSTTVNWTGTWVSQAAVITWLLDGANTQLRINGVIQSISSGGPLAATSMTTFRINGPGNAGFISDIREIIVAQTNNIPNISSLEDSLCVAHLGKISTCAN